MKRTAHLPGEPRPDRGAWPALIVIFLFVPLTLATTRTIATLFNSLRRSAQAFIDRRVFHRKSNAETILARFAASTREEVALEPITRSLLAAVEDTLQPAEISLWLRSSRGK